MTLSQFFDNPNQFVLWLAGFYIAGYIAVIVQGWRVGDKRSAQKAALYGIAVEYHSQELIYVIQRVLDEEPRILMPVKKNWILFVVSILVAVSGFCTAFFNSFVKMFPQISAYGPAVFAFLFAFFFFNIVLGVVLVAFQYKYLIAIERFRDLHIQAGSKKITVIAQ